MRKDSGSHSFSALFFVGSKLIFCERPKTLNVHNKIELYKENFIRHLKDFLGDQHMEKRNWHCISLELTVTQNI